jgi:hypothetical protein
LSYQEADRRTMWLLPLSGLVSGLATSVLMRRFGQVQLLDGIVFALLLVGLLGHFGNPTQPLESRGIDCSYYSRVLFCV